MSAPVQKTIQEQTLSYMRTVGRNEQGEAEQASWSLGAEVVLQRYLSHRYGTHNLTSYKIDQRRREAQSSPEPQN